jgi:hypothetical protein
MVQKYLDGLKLIPLENMTIRLAKAINECRPDLWQAIEDCGDEGMIYLARMTVHLLDLLQHPEKGVCGTAGRPRQDTVLARCEACKKEWPVARAKVADIKACPFCHTPAEMGA